MENKNFTVITDDGKEIEFAILFTYTMEETNKKYVYYYDPKQESPDVLVSEYDDEGNLFEVKEDEVWDKLEEIYNQFMEENEEGCCHHHDDDCDCDCDCEDAACDCEDDCCCDKKESLK